MFKRGQEILAAPSTPTIAAIDKALKAISARQGASIQQQEKLGRIVDQVFPADDFAKRVPAVLRLVSACSSGGLCVIDVDHRVQRLIETTGGAEFLLRHLEGRSIALTASYVLVLIDSGFNLQSCDELGAEPFVEQTTHGARRIATISASKMRARGEMVEATLVDGEAELPLEIQGSELSAVKAIQIWQEMSAPIRSRALAAESPVADRLWIYPKGKLTAGEVRQYNYFTFKNWWHQFLKRHRDNPVIGGLHIQPRMIRPTVLQIAAAHDNFEHRVAQLIGGQKSAAVATGYLSRPWFRKVLAEKIREFQNLFEATLATGLRDIAHKLGIEPDELERRQNTGLETGLGFHCLDPTGGHQPDIEKGRTCTKLDACATCSLRRFVATDSALDALVLFNRALREQGPEFEKRNPRRWNQAWLPYLALTEALIDKLNDSFRRPRLSAARTRIEEGVSNGSLVPLTLW